MRVDVREQLGCGQAHLVTDRCVAGDGQAGWCGTVRVDVGEQLRGGQAHLIADRLVGGDGREGFGGGAGVVFGELLGRVKAVLVGFVHGCVGFLGEVNRD
jgi:hypothetical protein